MKKVIVLLSLLLFVFAGVVFGEESLIGYNTSPEIKGDRGELRIITLTWTSGTDGSFTETQIGTTAYNPIETGGYQLSMVYIRPGDTGPTDDSDFYLNLTASDTNNYSDILQGEGANMVDNATHSWFLPPADGVPIYFPVYQRPYLKITGNIVNSAVVLIDLVYSRTVCH